MAHIYDSTGYGPQDEGPHVALPDPFWQESFWIYWGDGKGMGGVVHVSQRVPEGNGDVFVAAFAGDVAFRRRADQLPLNEAIRKDGGHGVGGYSFIAKDGATHLRGTDGELEIDCVFTDNLPYPSLLASVPGHADPKRVTSNSYQAPGLLKGTLKLGGKQFTVEAMAQRGHSWGLRNYAALHGRGSRFITGGLPGGPSFATYVAVRADGTIGQTAFIVDQGKATYIDDITVVVEADLDGVSHIGGRVELRDPTGKHYVFRCGKFDNLNHFALPQNTLINVAFGPLQQDGRSEKGWCAWEIQDRPPQPAGEAPWFLRGFSADGLHPIES